MKRLLICLAILFAGTAEAQFPAVVNETLSTLQTEGNPSPLAVRPDGTLLLSLNPPSSGTACSAADITDTTSTAIKAAVASNRIYVTGITCSNTSAVASRISFLDGATVVWLGMIKAGDGYTFSFTTPIRGTSNTAFNAQLATTATATRCCIDFYTKTT